MSEDENAFVWGGGDGEDAAASEEDEVRFVALTS
jgi:hypothetical protein